MDLKFLEPLLLRQWTWNLAASAGSSLEMQIHSSILDLMNQTLWRQSLGLSVILMPANGRLGKVVC